MIYKILAWQPLLRPPLPSVEPPPVPEAPLKAIACRNQTTSLTALITSDEPVISARLLISDLICAGSKIPVDNMRIRLIGAVPTPETGMVCDPLYDVEEFPIDKSTALYITINIPLGIRAGTYHGSVSLIVDGSAVAENNIEVEVAAIDMPDMHDTSFFLNVWMNPGTVARWHGVEIWSDEHFNLMRPYIEDLAAHGQKTAVVPICYQPWGTQTRDPYPNAVIWKKRGEDYEFDFSIFDRYVRLHEDCGIDRAIHCYSIAQAGVTDRSIIAYTDAETGEEAQLVTKIGDNEYVKAWRAFFKAFKAHLSEQGWLDKTYIAFDEKPPELMERLVSFINEYAQDFKTSLAGNTKGDLMSSIDDLSLQVSFNEHGIAQAIPPERSALGVSQLLDPGNVCAITQRCPDKAITTFYVCCAPEFPNTFLFSPLVESRMLPLLAAQGGYDGFLRWSYNDWPDNPYEHPEWASWPTGDTFFVYPGTHGPVSSLRWEQLREGIYDYELALLATANLGNPDEMVDYEQAIVLASRDVDGYTKSIGDIEIARRLLIPIAEHQGEDQ